MYRFCCVFLSFSSPFYFDSIGLFSKRYVVVLSLFGWMYRRRAMRNYLNGLTLIPTASLPCLVAPSTCVTRLCPCRSASPMETIQPMLRTTTSTLIGVLPSRKLERLPLVVWSLTLERKIWSKKMEIGWAAWYLRWWEAYWWYHHRYLPTSGLLTTKSWIPAVDKNSLFKHGEAIT